MKTVSEQEKAKLLLTLTEDDLGERSYEFVQGRIRRMSMSSLSLSDNLTEKQQQWFNDLYDKHFG